jgi:hypothetical protein
VVHSWAQYRQRVMELAGDLDSLARIRGHLRAVLMNSPVCDSERFAQHFGNALRAIWQRYCEGKPVAALTLDAQGQARFAETRRRSSFGIRSRRRRTRASPLSSRAKS